MTHSPGHLLSVIIIILGHHREICLLLYFCTLYVFKRFPERSTAIIPEPYFYIIFNNSPLSVVYYLHTRIDTFKKLHSFFNQLYP
ncbi:hypothetical protein F4811DRAFT_514409 [Daldinia bambusicola]|nr:hypothetical protein F4811DRAFT_514409 [Daldinia bambusicola]